MFGGLDLKGGDAKKKEETPPPAAPAASSAFAFFMGTGGGTTATATTTTLAEETATAVSNSGFSFLHSGGTSGVQPTNNSSSSNNSNKNKNEAAASAFSFMMAPAESVDPATTESNLSSFSFLQQSSAVAPQETGDNNNDNNNDEYDARPPPAASRSSSNGLGFLPSSDQTVSTISVEDLNVPAEDLLQPSPPSSSSSQLGGLSPGVVSFGTAVGAGVTFGAPNKSRTVKKRTRTAKIGAAAAAQPLPGVTPGVIVSARPEPTTTPLQLEQDTDTCTRKAAELAARRAEEFLQQKIRQAEATPLHNTAKVRGDAPLKFTTSTSSNTTASPPAIVSVPSEEDEVIAAAKKAAQEAHKIEEAMHQHQQQHSGRGVGAFSGLFRSRGRSPPATQSMRSLSASSSGGAGAAANMGTESQPATGVERLQKEQEQSKRAMAERQLQMLQQQQQQQQSWSEESQLKPTAFPHNSLSSSSSIAANATAPALSMKPIGVAVGSNTASSYAAPSSSLVPPQPNSSVVAPDVLSAPTPLTPMDEFHNLLDAFRTNAIQSMDKVTRLRGHRSGLLEERFVTTAKERLAVQQIQQAEALQTAAAEAEDFELADQLSQTIARHAQEQAEYAAILESITRALTELERQKQDSVRLVTQCFRDVQQQLQNFLQQQTASDTQDMTSALQTFSAVAKQLSAEQERLQSDWKHLERDAQSMAEERAELEKAISEQSGQFEQLRDQARAKLATVDEEMEELRMQLQAKQAVAAQLRTEAAGHDEAVLKVRVKFARQLNRLQNKEVTMKDNQEEWELEKRAYETNKAQHDAQVHAHSEAMLARDELVDALHRQVEMADTFESIVAKEIGFEANTNETADADVGDPSYRGCSDNDELAHLQANVVKCEAAVSESKAALQAVTTIVRNLEQEVQELERRIPMLEEAKTAAASQRDFKAAGKASREIKEAISRLAECQEELRGDATAKAEAAATELARHEHDLADAQTVAQAKERETAAVAMAHLADHIRRLVATKQQVCSADAAKNPRSVPAVGALVLQAQVRALQMEGQTYGDKYGGWEELMAGIDGVDDDRNVNDKNHGTDGVVAPPQDLSGEDTAPASDRSGSRIEPDIMDTEGEPQKQEHAEVDADNSSTSLEERMRRFRNVTRRLKEVEDQLEAAAVEEDYEKAEELDEILQKLLAEVEGLCLTDEEMVAAMALPPNDDNLAAAESTDEKVGEVLAEASSFNADDDANNDGDDDQEVTVPPVESVQSGASMDESQDDSPPPPDQLNEDNGSVEPAETEAVSDDESALPAIEDSKSFDSKAEENPCNHADTNGTSAASAVQSDDEE